MMKILIINQFADNKGDRAILFYLLQRISRHSDYQVTVSTSNPRSWAGENMGDVTFIKWGWDISLKKGILRTVYSRWLSKLCFPVLRHCILNDRRCPWWVKLTSSRFVRAARNADVIISTGGHHFTNWFSKDGTAPLFYDLALSEVLNRKVVLWSQTIGPLAFSSSKNQRLIARMMQKAHKIVIRDAKSIDEIKNAGVSAEQICETYDSVFGISLDSPVEAPVNRGNVVGVSIYTGPERALTKSHYISTMAEFIKNVINCGYKVVFLPMQLAGKPGDDREWIHEIVRQSGVEKDIQIIDKDLATLEHMKVVKDCRIFIGHKTHSIIFSLTVGTPLLAISYHQKTDDIMEQYGLSRYVVDENHLTADGLIDVFQEIEANLNEISNTQIKGSSRYAECVNQVFDSIIA